MIALGFRVKSGRSIAAVMAGTSEAPRLVACREVLMSDPDTPATCQPYHNGFGTAQQDETVIARLSGLVEQCTRRSIADLLLEAGVLDRDAAPEHRRRAAPARGATRARAVVVVGSVVDPATIANPHIRAHASEGRLFRTILVSALGDYGIAATLAIDKTLTADAARATGETSASLRRVLAQCGRDQHPWRADQKMAALAAWMLLPKNTRIHRL